MRILFTGAAPWVNSGYGKPGRYLFPRLVEAGHDVALAPFFGYRGATRAFRQGGHLIQMFPPVRDPYFNDVIQYHAGSFSADVVISLQDVWILQGWGYKGFTWCPRFPIDTHPVSAAILRAIEGCHTPLALTKWGQQELIEHGWPNAKYIPHGVDTNIYAPAEQAQAREILGLPPDTFIAGMVAANSSYPSRKSFPEVVQAWQKWGGDGILYLHATVTPKREEGIDFQKMLTVMGIDWSTLDDPDERRRARASVLFPCQHQMWCHAYSDEDLATIYNAMDVLLSPSMAEGFGIPIIEAQACGIPVITLNVTSMPELTFSGMCLDPMQMTYEPQGGLRGVAGVDSLVEALEWADSIRQAPTGRQHYADKARVNALEFDFDKLVDDYWLPFLEELEEDVCQG